MDYDEDPEPPNRQRDEWRELALKREAERDAALADAKKQRDAARAYASNWDAALVEGNRLHVELTKARAEAIANQAKWEGSVAAIPEIVAKRERAARVVALSEAMKAADDYRTRAQAAGHTLLAGAAHQIRNDIRALIDKPPGESQ